MTLEQSFVKTLWDSARKICNVKFHEILNRIYDLKKFGGNKRMKKIIVWSFLILFYIDTSVAAQKPYPLELNGNCEENASSFWFQKHYYENDQMIFVISKLGRNETSTKMSQLRLQSVVDKLVIGGIKKERIVTATGNNTGRKAKVEVYGGGYLLIIFELKTNERLLLRNCLYETSRKYRNSL